MFIIFSKGRVVVTESIRRTLAVQDKTSTIVIVQPQDGKVKLKGIGTKLVDQGPAKDIPTAHKFHLMDADKLVSEFFYTVS